ncbi:transformer-2 protein homolog beta-like [Hibiscus syriacus]|uniref:transformer-2 protein homolog beta-like n=1 Tax=Hibiscus syriacus TaxID=106335 RepID=UPI001923B895|nr:transformer-2 protein homolog beta-like [Hibiscus syriacus]
MSKRIHVSSLKEVFQVYGVVLDVFIAYKSLKRKSVGFTFAFVRFRNRFEANLAVRRADGRVLDGFKIRVFHEYKYDRLSIDVVSSLNKVWKPVLRDARSVLKDKDVRWE